MWVSFKICLRSRTRRCRRLLKYNFYIVLFCVILRCARPVPEVRCEMQKGDFGGQIGHNPRAPFNSVAVAIARRVAAAVCIMWVRVCVLNELYCVHSIVVGRVADVC